MIQLFRYGINMAAEDGFDEVRFVLFSDAHSAGRIRQARDAGSTIYRMDNLLTSSALPPNLLLYPLGRSSVDHLVHNSGFYTSCRSHSDVLSSPYGW